MGPRASVRMHAGASPAESADLLAAVAGTCDAVVVLGGDGMVHLALQALALGDTPLGIVAAGTGNDVLDVLGLPTDPMAAADAVLAALDAGSVRRVDLGRTDTGRWWATVLCAGFDSAVNERANRWRWPRGPRRYDLAIAAELAAPGPPPVRARTRRHAAGRPGHPGRGRQRTPVRRRQADHPGRRGWTTASSR